jgi:hypothetical protein
MFRNGFTKWYGSGDESAGYWEDVQICWAIAQKYNRTVLSLRLAPSRTANEGRNGPGTRGTESQVACHCTALRAHVST